MTASRQEALTWFQRGFQAAEAGQAARSRAQHQADRQAAADRLVTELVDLLARTLTEDDEEWRLGLTAAKAYRADRGHLRVPRDYVTADGFPLGAWIAKQRERRRRNALMHFELAVLTELGIRWLPPRRQRPTTPPPADSISQGRAA